MTFVGCYSADSAPLGVHDNRPATCAGCPPSVLGSPSAPAGSGHAVSIPLPPVRGGAFPPLAVVAPGLHAGEVGGLFCVKVVKTTGSIWAGGAMLTLLTGDCESAVSEKVLPMLQSPVSWLVVIRPSLNL